LNRIYINSGLVRTAIIQSDRPPPLNNSPVPKKIGRENKMPKLALALFAAMMVSAALARSTAEQQHEVNDAEHLRDHGELHHEEKDGHEQHTADEKLER
jgi:hypothetical protein